MCLPIKFFINRINKYIIALEGIVVSRRSKNKLVAPVLKWVGGKRQSLQEIRKYVPSKFSYYVEPFLGGGAVLFDLQPKKAIVNDINEELINVYNSIKNNCDELIDSLSKHVNDEEYFYFVREKDRDKNQYAQMTDLEKASRIIYLNKTCYNGLFRVNQAGEFNTPYGKYKEPNIVNEYILRAVSDYFNSNEITITSNDYQECLKHVDKNAFVYIDPPYDPVSDSSSFTGYSKQGFDKNEQTRLKEVCDALNDKGMKFLLSNSSTEFIKDLYQKYDIITIRAKRSINSKPSKRGEIDEVLIKNYDK